MSQSQTIIANKLGELVSPEGIQEGKNTCHLAAIRLQPLATVSSEGIQNTKQDTKKSNNNNKQDTDPRLLRCISQE